MYYIPVLIGNSVTKRRTKKITMSHTYQRKVQTVGSKGHTFTVSIPKHMALELGWESGMSVDIQMEGDRIIITN